MAKNIDLNSTEWCDIVFEGKNKSYGAYQLRQTSPRRHLLAVGIAVVFSLILIAFPSFIEFVTPEKEVAVQIDETTVLSNLEQAKEEEQPKDQIIELPPPPEVKSSVRLTELIIKEDEKVKEENEMKTQEELTETNKAISIKDVEGSTSLDAKDAAEVLTVHKEIVEEKKVEKPLEFVEQMPEYPGGEGELLKYISANFNIPDIVKENGIGGKFYVRFVVNKNGTVSDPVVERSIDPACDKEAIRLVKTLKFIPGKQNGQAVAVYFRVPINVKIQER